MQEEPLEYTERHFFTPTSIEKSGPIWPVRLGRNMAKPSYHAGPKVTAYYSLHFILQGEGEFVQANQSYPLRQGDAFCLFPNIAHEYYTSKVNPLHMAWIAFDGKRAAHVLERIGLTSASPYRTAVLRPEVTDLLDAFFDLVNDTERTQSDLARLGFLYSLFDSLTPAFDRRAGAVHEPTSSWLQKGLDYLEMHYTEGIGIEKVASFVGVDRGYFSKKFQEAYGVPPIKYLQKLKLDKAKYMLERTDYKLTEIALSVGYPDLFSFSKSFKKHYGMSPNAYRLNLPSDE
ncbi:AraC family transcriptional regulator [Paenibacillus allorhizosphaerae]|uniref:HTH-type transcriptional activator RhaS n=1 Tax=Paenibacillus allorhizosphaerae TaxID=2849866 RepID=A0ABM8VAC3_9BACL|nr:AraC family transcriptional regulator [Paenibacillus allorhizosphaerae]CAG7615331.1 HTH-type transcriptional activator RhaS [Paenibacillus allorhizosphaerae]